jgi:site-specific DNA-methyltransferase (adenine-specific)
MNMRKLINGKIEKTSIYLADCLDILRDWYAKGRMEFIDLIYIDPPFNSKRNYNVLFDSELSEEGFKDTWSNVAYLEELEEVATISPNLYNFLKLLDSTGMPKSHISYLTMMAIRCWYMKQMLKDTGSFYFHCDPTMSHYVKIVLDYIFENKNFRNEIVWWYNTQGKPKKGLAKKHDTIFFYTKSNKFKWNKVTIPPNDIKRYNKIEEGTGRRYQIDGKGYKYYLDDGRVCPDVWDVPALTNKAKERLGYPTQKPEKLIERIIKASSNEGDVVCDFFMGGGTTVAVAEKLGRIALGTDINYRAVQLTKKRLEGNDGRIKKDFFIFGIPRSSKELRKLVKDGMLGREKNSRFAFEDVIVKYYLHDVVGNEKKVGDNSIDGRFSFDWNKKVHTGLVQVTTGA